MDTKETNHTTDNPYDEPEKNFYRIKRTVLCEALCYVRFAMGETEIMRDHEVEFGDIAETESELDELDESLCDVENFLENMISAVEPLYQEEVQKSKEEALAHAKP